MKRWRQDVDEKVIEKGERKGGKSGMQKKENRKKGECRREKKISRMQKKIEKIKITEKKKKEK